MKTLFACFVAFLFAFIIGCQESFITDPVSNDTEINLGTAVPNNVDKDIIHFYPGAIKLTGMLYDPSHFFNSYAEMSGIVRYRVDQMPAAQLPTEKSIKVLLYVSAELKAGCPGQNHLWTVKKTTEQIVTVSSANQSVIYVEKSFRVCNTCCAPLNLVLKFQVDEKVVTLVSKRLMKVPGWVRIKDEM